MATHSLEPNSGALFSEVNSIDDFKGDIPNAKGAPTDLQTLLKGDSVFSLTDEVDDITPSLSSIFRAFRGQKKATKNTKFTTGTVLLSKEWGHSNCNLCIRWANGKFEKLSKHSSTLPIAYGDRLFVLERECIGSGSRVSLAGYPAIKGTVKNKRFLATGRCTENLEVIFEDIDVSLLHHHTHGTTYKDVKILYQDCWLGVATNFRTRLHLKLKSAHYGFSQFCFVLEGHLSQKYNIGDEITLGLNLLGAGRLAGAVEIEDTHWLLNVYRFFNAKATIIDIEIDELHVHWIGKAGNPEFYPTSFNFPDSPPTIIPYHELKNVKYLFSTKHCQVAPNSVWKYKHSPNAGQGEEIPTSRENWASKWLKLVDWDRWVYPHAEDVSEKSRFWRRDLALEIMYIRSVVDVIWQDGKESTMNPGDVIPVHLGSVWSDWSLFHNGTVVGSRKKTRGGEQKYAVILQLSEEEVATVNWIQQGNIHNQNLITTDISKVPLYDLVEEKEYDYLRRLSQSPLVSATDGSFKVGVVVGAKTDNGQVAVKVPMEKEKKLWPHQLCHYKCDVMICPMEGCWTAWYDHVTLETSRVAPNDKDINSDDDAAELHDQEKETFPSTNTKRQLTFADKIPTDNIFTKSNIPLTLLDSKSYRGAVENELKEIQGNIPDGMWIEYYFNPGNVMSSVMAGPKNSLFEDILFIFDVLLQEDFPKSVPHINFRSLGVTIIPGHFCSSGLVFIPEEAGLTEKECTCSEILNSLLEMKHYMGIPLDAVCELEKNDSGTLIGGGNIKDCDELRRFVLISVLNYTIALLQDPPRNWEVVIHSHYTRALPGIVKRFSQIIGELKKVTNPLNDDRGNSILFKQKSRNMLKYSMTKVGYTFRIICEHLLPMISLGDISTIEDGVELVAHSWSETYMDCFHERLQKLKKMHVKLNI